jgi:hypothetical protein
MKGYIIILGDIEKSFYDEIQKQYPELHSHYFSNAHNTQYEEADWETTISLQLDYAQ